ncbi:glycosyltransferase [Salinibacter ruber]|uniref:glycosyltransferase n=1 Tax=Salinibacter ruber TaxID=146919 RepID=UPI000E568C31|nr:glycosyltransferase [Salinibacter ruber]
MDRQRHDTKNTTSSRVALYMPSLDGGGAERVMVTVANALIEQGHSVDLVLVRAKGDYDDLVHENVNVIDLQASRILVSLPKLIRYLQDQRPDAMLSTLFFTNVVATWACRWVADPPRLVLREANTISAKSAEASDPKFRLMPYLTRWFYPWADRVVTVSKAAGEDLVQTTGVTPEKVQTIYNPVVTDDLYEKAQEPLDHPWFQDEAPPVVLGAGRLERQKDFKTLIRAFKLVREGRPARLVILGKGSQKKELRALAQSLGVGEDVLLPGFVDNPFKYMARVDAFVLSSRFEGLPGVLIQAMATGCPVVSTDCPSGPQEILEGGRYGPLVPIGNVEAMARGMQKILNNPTETGKLKRGADRFHRDRAIEKYFQVVMNK